MGEKAGQYWFSTVLNIQLEDIEDADTFEMFDYKIADLDVYVDFKNWHETTQFDKTEMIEKVISKAKLCNAKCVIVANIITQEKYDISVTHHDCITLVRCPSLMLDNTSSVDINLEAAYEIRRCLNAVRINN